MRPKPMDEWHAIVETRDMARLDRLLGSDCTHTTYYGRRILSQRKLHACKLYGRRDNGLCVQIEVHSHSRITRWRGLCGP